MEDPSGDNPFPTRSYSTKNRVVGKQSHRKGDKSVEKLPESPIMSNIVIKLHNRNAINKKNLLDIKSFCTKAKLELLNNRLTLEELSNKHLILISQIEELAEIEGERGHTAHSSIQGSNDFEKTPNTTTSNITQSFGKHLHSDY